MQEIAAFLGRLGRMETKPLSLVEGETLEKLVQQGRVPEKVPGPIEADYHSGAFYVIPPIGVGPNYERVIVSPEQVAFFSPPPSEEFRGYGQLTFVPEELVDECDRRIEEEV